MKKIIIILTLFLLVSCGAAPQVEDQEGLRVVTSSFPLYEFVREIAGDSLQLELLLPPGAEVHSYEVSPVDMKKITNSDLFLYVGGDSDHWIDEMMESSDLEVKNFLRLMDHVKLLSEEESASMVAEEDEHEDEYDEHIWLSLENSQLMVDAITDKLVELDADKADAYKSRSEQFKNELSRLEEDYKELVDTSLRKVIIVGDRFPFLYLVRSLGLDYDAAYPGCSANVEENAQAIKGLIDRVRAEDIPVVFTIEMSRGTIADRIVEETGAKKLMLHSLQNVTKEEMEAGEGFISLMEKNLEVLEEALN
ncbi:MAG: zinc ABC transporter substrate-binding protein [Tissierellia bacterium]|nr:zinc ABC transporter substrate-binding protein [Tissierellia bacterium]